MCIYAGFKDWNETSLSQIYVNEPSLFPDAIAELHQNAEIQRNQGARYMRVFIYTYVEMRKKDPHSGHAENIDIDRLFSFNLNNMKDGEIYWIGDRNRRGHDDFTDIPRIAIRKAMDSTKRPSVPKYEWVIVRNAERPNGRPDFKKIDLQYFEVYTRQVRKYEASETT
jgi:hypothetical protein